MINVLHAIDTPGPGGAETVFLDTIRLLDKSRFRSYAAIPGRGYLFDQLLKEGIQPIIIESKGSFSFRYLVSLIRAIRRYRIDIVQSHLFGSNVYCSIAGIICRKPVISVFHGFVDVHKRDLFLKMRVALVDSGSFRTVFVSDHLKMFFVNNVGFSSNKAVTIYNGIEVSKFTGQKKDPAVLGELGFTDDHFIIGAIGNIRQAKGYEYLVRAAAFIHATHPQCRVVVAGEGTGELFRTLQELKTNLGLDHVVRFIGYRHDTVRLFNIFDAFVVSSLSEGFSIATLEALASNVPVVATRSGGPEEIIDNGRTGLLVAPQNAEMLAEAVTSLINDNNLRSLLTANGYKVVRDRFDVVSMIASYAHLYDRCLQKR